MSRCLAAAVLFLASCADVVGPPEVGTLGWLNTGGEGIFLDVPHAVFAGRDFNAIIKVWLPANCWVKDKTVITRTRTIAIIEPYIRREPRWCADLAVPRPDTVRLRFYDPGRATIIVHGFGMRSGKNIAVGRSIRVLGSD